MITICFNRSVFWYSVVFFLLIVVSDLLTTSLNMLFHFKTFPSIYSFTFIPLFCVSTFMVFLYHIHAFFFLFKNEDPPPQENCLPWVFFYTQLLKSICYFSFILLICDGFPWQYLLSDIDLLFLVNIWQLRVFLLFLLGFFVVVDWAETLINEGKRL